eukprot:632775_1
MESTSSCAPKRSEFAVDMQCSSCEDSVTSCLQNAEGISNFRVDLANQTVVLESGLSTEELYKILGKSGKRVKLRSQSGMGVNNLGAAVAVLHSRRTGVMGIARFIQLSQEQCSIEATIDNLPPNSEHGIHIHEFGQISDDGAMAGKHFNPGNSCHGSPDSDERHVGDLGNIASNSSGRGRLSRTDARLKVWDIIGRSVCVEAKKDEFLRNDDGSGARHLVCGVLARSAGLFENTKRICECDGSTIWEEDTSAVNWTAEAARAEQKDKK